ncbi:Uncharacterised protein [Yersinia aldovae]|uniref:hypothetical protein n=1 Tax=Yersinia aldovae TaxID=29483 RepID=UPI0005E168BF|nr:hypothetical protein [Yersinia aldovae]CNJ17979.1 Uncharacterised protein [Yersinia aldovae]
MKIEIIIAITGTIISVIAIIASYFSGVRVGKVNEIRKEWNALVEPMLIILEAQRLAYTNGSLSKYDRKDFDFPYERINAIKRRLSGRKLASMSEKYSAYYKARVLIVSGEEKRFDKAIKAIDEFRKEIKLQM